MPIVVCDQVTKAFGAQLALREVSLEVNEGEVFGLLGPNGAGKTTLIRILLDILRPDAGRVLLFGERPGPATAARLGYLPEERGLYRRARVQFVLSYLAELRGIDRRAANLEARKWLSRVGLEHVASQRMEQLSKGMSQKVQLAAALLTDPELCILDEPFSGLDPVNVQLVHDLIVERRKASKTTILSTHQMNKVEDLCDRVALVHEGVRKVYGATQEVRRLHSSPAAKVRLTSEWTAWPPGIRVLEQDDGDLRLEFPAEVPPAALLADLVQRGAPIERFDPAFAPMEEVFVHAVQSTGNLEPPIR